MAKVMAARLWGREYHQGPKKIWPNDLNLEHERNIKKPKPLDKMIQDLCLWNSIPNSKPSGKEFALLPKKLLAAVSRILNPSSGFDLDADLELGLWTVGLQLHMLHKSCNQFYSCLPSMSFLDFGLEVSDLRIFRAASTPSYASMQTNVLEQRGPWTIEAHEKIHTGHQSHLSDTKSFKVYVCYT